MIFLLALIVFFIGAQSHAVPTHGSFSRGSSTFGFELYKKTFEASPSKSVVISPMSVHTALGLTFMGAGGTTASQMAEVLHLGSTDRLAVGINYKNIMDTYNNNPVLKLANKIYTQTGYKATEEFREIAVGTFHSDAEEADFNQKEKAAATINDWVMQKTNNKIHDLVSKDLFTDDTRMVLVNAVYFKGDWETPFVKRYTSPRNFSVSESVVKKIPTMKTKGYFNYGTFDNLEATGIEMNYKNSDISIVFLLPNQKQGIANLINRLASTNLLDLEQSMTNQEVTVFLPRFKTDFDIHLKDILISMGMKDAFNEADLSLLLEDPRPLKVAEVVHKAFLEVNEEGTEASAATAVFAEVRTARAEKNIVFRADHPFVYYMKDAAGNVLFIGSFLNE